MKKVYTFVTIMLLGGGTFLAQEFGLSRSAEEVDITASSEDQFTAKSADCGQDVIIFPVSRSTDQAYYPYGTDRGTAQIFPHSANATVTGVVFIGASEEGFNNGVGETDIEFEAFVYSTDDNGDLGELLHSETILVNDNLTNFQYVAFFSEGVSVDGDYAIALINRDDRSVLLGNSGDGDANGDDLSFEYRKLDPDDDDEVPDWYKLSALYDEDVDNFIYSIVENTIEANFSVNSDGYIDSTVAFVNSSIIDTLGYHNLSGTIFEWNFGDGSPVSNEFEPEHVYTNCGEYDVQLTITYEDVDGDECNDIITIPVSITNTGDNLILNATNTSICGEADGQIEMSLELESSEFSYDITEDGLSDGVSLDYSATAEDLAAGTYNILVTLDDNNCEIAVSQSINDGGAPQVELASSGVSCAGKEDAWITVIPQVDDADTVNYTFTWSTGVDADSIEVGAGNYSVTGTDGTCTFAANISVQDGNLLDIELNQTSNVQCAGDENADLAVTSPDGVDLSGYVFIWSQNNTEITGEEGTTLTGVGAGNYKVVGATDAGNECNTTEESITVTQPTAVSISGGEVSYTDIENAEITGVSASGGTGTLSFSWEGPSDFTSEDEDISVTENGTYTVTVTDENGCTATESYAVGELSVADLAAHNINVYPNPASTTINFDVEGSDAKNIYVYDASGRSITSLDVNSTVVEFNVESLATGLYMYHITGQDGGLIVSSKFSVSK